MKNSTDKQGVNDKSLNALIKKAVADNWDRMALSLSLIHI